MIHEYDILYHVLLSITESPNSNLYHKLTVFISKVKSICKKKKKIVEIKEINNNKHEEESYLLTYLYRIDRGVRSSVLGRSLFIITYLARWRGKHVVSRRCSHM